MSSIKIKTINEEEQTIETPIKSVDESLEVTERLTKNAEQGILPARYLTKNADGELTEDISGMFSRVAENVAGAETTEEGRDKWAEEFQHQMETLRFMPNSPTLMNAGTDMNQLSACFVLEPEDDMEDIFKTAKDAALVFQSGGGVGYSFSDLRPKGAYIGSTGGEASGPVSFMRVFDETCNQVKQGGKRRGAQMGILRVDHPDVGRFTVAKRMEGEFSNFNISVGYTDEFVEAVQNGEEYTLYDPTTDYEEPYEVREQTAHFYNISYEDNPKNAYDDGEGAVVDENLWRDYADEITTTDGVSLREKWAGRILLDEGDDMSLPAEFLWDIMVDGAWQNGEPGLFHLDETNREHSFDADEYPKHEINATNPCMTGDTLVNTPNGLIRTENVDEGDTVSTIFGSETVDEILTYENQSVYQVNLSDGGSVKATEDHRFHFCDGKKSVDKNTPLRDISEGDKIRLEPSTFENEGTEEDYKYQLRRGILTGDGGYTQKTIDVNNRLSISSSEDDTEFNQNVRKLFEDSGYNVGKLDTSGRNKSVKLWISDAEKVLEDHNLDPSYSHEKNVDVTEFETQAGVQGFLDGMLATDGSVSMSSNRPQIRWSTSSEKLANNIRNLALNVGMHARIYEDERKNRGGSRSDGSEIGGDETHTLYNVHVAGESADTFVRNTQLSEYHVSKGERLETLRTDFMLTGGLWQATVESVELCEERETVFDIYCSDSDTWVTEGYVNRGCAEQPLSEYEACNLGHINLSLLLKDNAPTYDEYDTGVEEYIESVVDFSNLDRTIEAGVRFLDNVVTQSDFPIEEIEDRVSGQRKIGLGIMGFAQMLYQMGIPYGGEESFQVARCMMRYIDRRGTDVSNSLAKERGSFDYWSESKYADPERHSEWFERHTGLPAEDYPDGYKIRNHNITTIAPTGTTSMIGNTSGGCEPVYNVANFKNVGNDIQGDDVLVEFDDYFLQALEANGLDVESIKENAESIMRDEDQEFDGVDDLDIPEKLKEIFVTTQDLTSRQHGLMQRAFQEFCDSGISKTINMPNEATREDVADAYSLAFKTEEIGDPIKGLTVYRDGSRDEQVLTTRMDNSLEDDEAKEEALDLFLSGEISEKAAQQLGVTVEGDGASCPEDDCEGTLQPTDDCAVCDMCFYSPC